MTYRPPFTQVAAAFALTAIISGGSVLRAQAPPNASSVVQLWGEKTPRWEAPTESELDTTGPDGRLVAGAPVVRLGNVSIPELHVYPADGNVRSNATVIIAPGGGYSILAWDLEGIEVARWLNRIGVDAAVLKYRVPTRSEPKNWLAAVQDIQRSISLIRDGKVPGVNSMKVGVLGFSAGGNASARTLTADQRHYEAIDKSDIQSCSGDFGILVYPAWLIRDGESMELLEDLSVDERTPPMFFAHAVDDRVDCLSSVALFTALKRRGLPSALHVFPSGGHGFGLREAGLPTDRWPELCEDWLQTIGVLTQ